MGASTNFREPPRRTSSIIGLPSYSVQNIPQAVQRFAQSDASLFVCPYTLHLRYVLSRYLPEIRFEHSPHVWDSFFPNIWCMRESFRGFIRSSNRLCPPVPCFDSVAFVQSVVRTTSTVPAMHLKFRRYCAYYFLVVFVYAKPRCFSLIDANFFTPAERARFHLTHCHPPLHSSF